MEQARQVEDQKRSVEEPMHSQEYDAPPIDNGELVKKKP
jgi:hypothetical protein